MVKINPLTNFTGNQGDVPTKQSGNEFLPSALGGGGFELIGDYVFNGQVTNASISIPSGYRILMVKFLIVGFDIYAPILKLTFNNSNQSYTYGMMRNNTFYASNQTDAYKPMHTNGANVSDTLLSHIIIHNNVGYTKYIEHKLTKIYSNGNFGEIYNGNGAWVNTSEISSVQLSFGTAKPKSGSKLVIYGIK